MYAGRSKLPDSSHASMMHRRSACAGGFWAAQDSCSDGEAGEDRVAVVGAAAAVQALAAHDRRPRAEALVPAGHLGLLVEVAVEEDGVAVARPTGRESAGHVDEDDRRAITQPDDLQRRAIRKVGAGPAGEQVDGLVHVAVRLPLRVEHRRLVGDLDVLGQRRTIVLAKVSSTDLRALAASRVMMGIRTA